MPNTNCLNCNHHGEKKDKEIWCYFWHDWFDVKWHCEHFVTYAAGMLENIRADSAKQLRTFAEQEAREKRQEKDARTLSNSLFENVLLEKEQKELLCTIVEASRNVPPDKREEFFIVRSSDGNYIQHSGLPEGEIEFYPPYLQTLIREGLIQLTGFNQRGEESRFDVLPRGFLYYKYLKEKSGEPVEQIEETVHSYIDAHTFQKEFPKAYEKWVDAKNLLWETETSKQLTKIGHLCREAIQEFMDALYVRLIPSGEPLPKDKTKIRLKKIIEAKSQKLGEAEKKFLNGLLEYFKGMNELIQKQEHDAQKEKIQLVWEDGRRVVFQTMMLMYEVSRSLK